MKTRPRPPERLQKILARVARERGLDQERLRRWVSFLAICGVLERAAAEGVDGLSGYYIKGGVAIELRFALHARATRDLDLVLAGDRGTRLRSFERALKLGFDQFTFRLKTPARELNIADTVRVEVAIQYRTRAWQTVEVDLGPAGSTSVDLVEPVIAGLHEMGLPVTSPVRCISLNEQVAQKLHACTTGATSINRARDVLDILLVEILGQLDYAATRAAAGRVFEERGTNGFPPDFAMPPIWRPELEALARQLSFPACAADEIERMFRGTLQKIAQAVDAESVMPSEHAIPESGPRRRRAEGNP